MIVAAAWPRLKEMTKTWRNGSAYPVMGVVLLAAVAGIFGIAAPLMVDLPFNSLALLPIPLCWESALCC